MTDPATDPATAPEGAERPPWPQLLMDDVFLLVMAGLVVPTLLYIVWGLMELGSVPVMAP